MKKLLTAIFILCTISSIAQRQRVTATFDADTTRPSSGMFGITVIKGQPYLVGNTGYAQRIETSPLFIKATSFGVSNKNVTLDTTTLHYYICGDSVNINFPPKTQFAGKKYHFQYYLNLLGFRGGTDSTKMYTPFDSTYRYTFSDTIFFYDDANKATYFTKIMSHDAAHRWWQVTNARSVYLELIENRWYLFYADIKF